MFPRKALIRLVFCYNSVVVKKTEYMVEAVLIVKEDSFELNVRVYPGLGGAHSSSCFVIRKCILKKQNIGVLLKANSLTGREVLKVHVYWHAEVQCGGAREILFLSTPMTAKYSIK